MNKTFSAVLSLITIGLTTHFAWAVEPTWNYAVEVSASVQTSPPQITLSWPQDTSGTPNSYTVYRKAPGATSWAGGTTLSGSATSFVDSAGAGGTANESAAAKDGRGYNSYGYVPSGINMPPAASTGTGAVGVHQTDEAR